jgi:molybdenum cofactor biosynthesis protein B
MTTGLQQHHQLAMAQGAVTIALVTVSDTRTPATDANYAYLRAAIPAAGHRLSAYQIIPDDVALVQTTLAELASTEAQVILFNGGTGIAKRDTTFDALNQYSRKNTTRIWGTVSHVKLRPNRRGCYAVTCNSRCVP